MGCGFQQATARRRQIIVKSAVKSATGKRFASRICDWELLKVDMHQKDRGRFSRGVQLGI